MGLQSGATGAVKAIKMSSKLVAGTPQPVVPAGRTRPGARW